MRVNHQIRIPKVRVVTDDGGMLGVMSSRDAIKKADEMGLDLVEISPKANPPVCKIMDYGKYKYEQKKKSQGQKKQVANVVKELKLSPHTDEHDINFKTRNAIRFLESGYRVKFVVRFRGRQMAHPELGRQQMDKIQEILKDHGSIENAPKMEGRFLVAFFVPKQQQAVKEKPKTQESSKQSPNVSS